MIDYRDGPAAAAGRITLDDGMTVNRLGFGAMRLTGPGIWGEPNDPEECRRVLRRALELGIDFIDTADSYGPEVSERLIAEVLHPYPPGLVIATKGGLLRPGPGQWVPDGRPEHLRAALEGSLRRLRVDQVDLYQLHRPDPAVPFDESVGTLINLREEGKVRAIGLSNVNDRQLRTALRMTTIASVQNRYNLEDRQSEGVLRMCEEQVIAFIPWAPIQVGDRGPDAARRIAGGRGISIRQLALAWMLAHSDQMLPIPGTASMQHLEENVAAAAVRLTSEEVRELEAAYGLSRRS
jgi:aryl-alcohol dehydrogenase-like predicted oxidoreductase